MFSFQLKNSLQEIDVVITRSLLAFAGLTALFYQTGSFFIINIIVGIILLSGSFLVDYFFTKLKIKKIVLLATAAGFLFIATHSVAFAIVLLLIGMLANALNKKPLITINERGIFIQRSFGSNNFNWGHFNNIILKDNLLSIDFKNNKLLQLEIDAHSTIDENIFNHFCKMHLQG